MLVCIIQVCTVSSTLWLKTYKIADGRGYPDISAQGLYFAFVWNQTFSSISGTSASTPLAASIISLVNDDLIACGRPPLGFLNPWLYKKGYKGFTDVTGGNTSSCGTAGFPVTKGWDPVTGFGTPVSEFYFQRTLI
jgi:tripeptidyl-peptidase-1